MSGARGAVLKAWSRALVLDKRQEYEEGLLNFAEYVWPVVEPAIPFVKGWVLEAICEHLEAVADGWRTKKRTWTAKKGG